MSKTYLVTEDVQVAVNSNLFRREMLSLLKGDLITYISSAIFFAEDEKVELFIINDKEKELIVSTYYGLTPFSKSIKEVI